MLFPIWGIGKRQRRLREGTWDNAFFAEALKEKRNTKPDIFLRFFLLFKMESIGMKFLL